MLMLLLHFTVAQIIMILIMTVKENKLKLKCWSVLKANSAVERANVQTSRSFGIEKTRIKSFSSAVFISFCLFWSKTIFIDLEKLDSAIAPPSNYHGRNCCNKSNDDRFNNKTDNFVQVK